MDPITAVVTALALGATSALKDTAATVIKDAYAGLKAIIQKRYAKVDIKHLEEAPQSKARRDVLKEDMEKVGLGRDNEILRKAKELLDAVRQHDPDAAAAIGIDLEDFEAGSLTISDVIAQGTGVRVERTKIAGAVNISGVRAGGSPPPKKA
jgi:hypothetical protein